MSRSSSSPSSPSCGPPSSGADPIAALRDDLRGAFPRVALVHEWMTTPGGSEKVVAAILDLLPHAELFVTVLDPAPYAPLLRGRTVHVSPLRRVPGANRHYPKLLPLMDAAVRAFDLRGFDLVVSSSHAVAAHARVPAGVPHVSYCHTPMRYAWEPSFLADELPRRLRPLARPVAARLRGTDRRRAAGVTAFAANSHAVAQRIADSYDREAAVIHPPVDVDRFLGRPRRVDPDAPYVLFGRLVPYKRPADAVAACAKLDRPLVVAGDGRGRAAAEALAGPRTDFRGKVSDAEAENLLAGARALLFPGLEDFGIVPVEAQAAGCPVVALDAGGAKDTVLDGETGVRYAPEGPVPLAAAIERLERLDLDPQDARAHARRFAPAVFAERFGSLLMDQAR